MPWDLAGKKVAVVGNGAVKECGKLIDSCDEVIRISTMRNWLQSAEHDGLKTTIWAGHPWLVVHRRPTGELGAISKFAELMMRQPRLWAVSPFHISVDSYRWLCENGHIDRMLVNPSWAEVYEVSCSKMESDGIRKIFSISYRKDMIGFNNYELLLTGTRILFLLNLCGVSSIKIFGANLFNFSMKGVWIGHNLEKDYDVIMYIKNRIIDSGGDFYWHEEEDVKKTRILKKFRIFSK